MTRKVGLAMIALAIVSLVAASGGASSVAVERSIEVAVTDDPSAQPVAFYTEASGENDSRITVTNRVDEELTVTEASVDESRVGDWGQNVSVDRTVASADPGSNASVIVTDVPCGDAVAAGGLPIEITVEAGLTTIETTVDAAVACDG